MHQGQLSSPSPVQFVADQWMTPPRTHGADLVVPASVQFDDQASGLRRSLECGVKDLEAAWVST